MTPRRRPPTKWELRLEAEARERARNLAELLAELRAARDAGEHWYQWIIDGRPVLTEAEYAIVGRNGRGRPASSSTAADRAELEHRADTADRQGTIA